MSDQFKSFLQGLLVKNPKKRFKWEDILEHPFMKKTQEDLNYERKIKKKYINWMNKIALW